MSAEARQAARQPLDGAAPAAPAAAGRPWALTVLWVCLMAPLSLAGTALQPHSLVSYTVFPLVMVAPAVAALLCWLAVPGWFPADAPHAAAGRVGRTVIGLGAASAVFVAVIMPFGAGRPMILSERLPTAPAVVAVIAGLTVGSLCEETGYRGVMFRALSVRLRPMPAVAVNGVFFALCHLQVPRRWRAAGDPVPARVRESEPCPLRLRPCSPSGSISRSRNPTRQLRCMRALSRYVKRWRRWLAGAM